MYKILVVDDEDNIREVIREYAEFEGHEVDEACDGMEAVEKAKSKDYDIIIMDIMMPRLDGYLACKEIRKFKQTPVLMLSARGEEYDKLFGFELGIDDYVVKPFSPAVLVKRIEALLRRRLNSESSGRISLGDLIIDKSAHTAAINSVPLNLTLKEFELLCYFADHPDQVISRDELLHSVWGYEYIGDARTVDSHMARLRLKLGDYGNSHIRTVYRMGYRFES